MKIALLTIATNNYTTLLKDLIESVDKFYLPEIRKDIYVFSDRKDYTSNNNNLVINEIKHEQWPFVTLKRFEYFLSILDRLKEYDKIVYLDCDLIIKEQIVSLPNSFLFGVCHPSNIFDIGFWPTEKNPKSTAFLPLKKSMPYVQGCLWGGDSHNIIQLIENLYYNIKKDLTDNFVAAWHDESHLNKFFSYYNRDDIKILNPGYAYPENWQLNFKKMIVHRDKNFAEYPRFEGVK